VDRAALPCHFSLCDSHDVAALRSSCIPFSHSNHQQLLLPLTCISHVISAICGTGVVGVGCGSASVGSSFLLHAAVADLWCALACRMNAGRRASVEIVLGDREFRKIEATQRFICCAVLPRLALKLVLGVQAGDGDMCTSQKFLRPNVPAGFSQMRLRASIPIACLTTPEFDRHRSCLTKGK
jgi:hypothetical protein